MNYTALLLFTAFSASAPAAALTLNWSFVPAIDSSGSFAAIKGTVSGLAEGNNSGDLIQAFITASPFADALGGAYDYQYSPGAGLAFVVTGGIVTYADAVFAHDGIRLYLADTAGAGKAGLTARLDGPSLGEYAISDAAPRFTPLAAGSVPEPANWVLLIAGFGLTGAALRRRTALHARG